MEHNRTWRLRSASLQIRRLRKRTSLDPCRQRRNKRRQTLSNALDANRESADIVSSRLAARTNLWRYVWLYLFWRASTHVAIPLSTDFRNVCTIASILLFKTNLFWIVAPSAETSGSSVESSLHDFGTVPSASLRFFRCFGPWIC